MGSEVGAMSKGVGAKMRGWSGGGVNKEVDFGLIERLAHLHLIKII